MNARMRLACLGLVYACLVGGAQPAWSAPPKVDALFPAGLQRGATVRVTAVGAFDPWPVQIRTDRADVQIQATEEKGVLSVTVPADAVPGLRRVRLFNEAGTATVQPLVIGLLPEVLEAEPNNAPRQPQELAPLPVVINGRLEASGDADLYAVTLKAGEQLVATVEAHQPLGSPFDCVLQILDAQGFVLAHNDDEHGLDPQLVFAPRTEGRYLVRVFGFPALPDSSIALSGGPRHIYRLSLTTGPWIDHAWPPAAAASAPQPVELVGWNLTAASVTPQNDPATVFGRTLLAWKEGLANVVKVASEPRPVLAVPRGATAPPTAIAVDSTIVGRIEKAGQRHTLSLAAKQGQPVEITIAARAIDSPLDPLLLISDDTGKVLLRSDDVGAHPDVEAVFNPPADGTYRLTVEDLYQRGGMRFVYVLRALAVQPRLGLTVAADQFTLTAGTPLEIPVTIDRRHGLAEEIEITVTGLPAPIVAMPVKSLPTGETAKSIKLLLNAPADFAGFSGPVQIVGKSLGPLALSATALPTAAPPAPPLDPEVWLTAVPKAP